MRIQAVERIVGNEDMLRVTMAGGTIYHVPDDLSNIYRQRVARWEAGGGQIANPSAAERRTEARREKAEQIRRYAEWLKRQHESGDEQVARMDRTTLYAAAALNGTTLAPELEAAALVDMVTADYLIQINSAMEAGLAVMRALSTLTALRAFDPRTDITWPIPPT